MKCLYCDNVAPEGQIFCDNRCRHLYRLETKGSGGIYHNNPMRLSEIKKRTEAIKQAKKGVAWAIDYLLEKHNMTGLLGDDGGFKRWV